MVGRMIVRIVSSLFSIEVFWKAPIKDNELTTLVLVICANRLLLVVGVIVIVVVLRLSKTVVSIM